MKSLYLSAALFAFAVHSLPKELSSGFIMPRNNAVISDNLVKIAVPGIIEGDTIKWVRFFVFYSILSSNKMKHSIEDAIIDIDSVPPFEAIWDCSKIPDQDNFNLGFFCHYVTSKNELKGGFANFAAKAALDRNKELSGMEWITYKTDEPIKIDGNLEEWFAQDSIVFINNDNRIIAASKWDKTFLYFAVRVTDADIFPAENDTQFQDIRPYMQDEIEFYFDINHGHGSIRDTDDYQIMVPANGTTEMAVFDFRRSTRPEYSKESRLGGKTETAIFDFKRDTTIKAAGLIWNPKTRIKKTSAGYDVEAAFPWKEFGLKPKHGITIGFNLVNTDRENKFGVVMTKSWANISDLVLQNPSEWGNLRLVDRNNYSVLVFCCALALAVLSYSAYIIRRKKRLNAIRDAAEVSMHESLINTVKEYLRQNFHDETLDLTKAASNVNLSPDYLRKLFVRQAGDKFSNYLNKIRMEKAQELLKNTNKRVSEIAFEVGYGTLENFNRVFKSSVGTTPSEYRKHNLPK
ncbi:MAG: hypothetical protein A2268_13580 [Candidatus Raymondbacteria bacterium RifOxyA12_full_50_37]|uniref:HTH araC/xylS-type domain-containing protein n=1 Tax=Candidatus Raymondbacteria bacterium RIFOXYD12_FULL_49_13 TaxID=1817890 RepID=A0A1F7F8N4_UNCRA|nr:MAG: hypothetical protein A2350_08210 [Candidatus Raymondbacteria bacterium RifOxyB12_full_50_8]OGJ90418.1 MAG: hypothetical protein A2268_13580 [Candidatus Raymondbacteria bacterium RifOxyA12_full_50_37]OGJ91500.1 MAG: hypothetical protein A2248_03615 [Candidatus Raymondbacteria bacterium RIFOXYA2_FULL_49_16]OGJ97814.1 MAG: hypothetical protein A2453_14000 [Candidatus Raymondbacteria bacterium RIFOXYC2_FULL_50_21]OGK02991.1 MAG: hypothetical protein A2519_06505 [Candidatus Raymondbacteria b